MLFQQTTATKKIAAMKNRIRAVPGGTSASKTISILIYLIARCQSDRSPKLTSIVSESFPHLRRGAMRDFMNIMKSHNYFDDKLWSESNKIYTFETGSTMEFFSADQPEKLRGGRRDRLFLNECNNIPFSAFEELEVRTREFVYLDWNPTSEFWYYTDVKPKRDDVEEVTLTYKDNEALDKSIIDSIEQRKDRKSWWQVYGLGQLGEIETRIYTGWEIIDEIPHQARLEARGLDFGYTNDPTVLTDIYRFNNGYILDERLYQTGMLNRQIADFIIATEDKTIVIADSAEPKSIDELKLAGVNIIGAKKGQGSVNEGIDFVKSQRISITKRSTNLIKSYRNYLWMTDRDGKILNVPDHNWSDGCDSIRYGLSLFRAKQEDKAVDYDILTKGLF
jgi:phage terminase large subunit